MAKTTIKIDSQALEPWRDIAVTLGIPLNELLEWFLSAQSDQLRSLSEMGEVISDWPFKTRQRAQSVADRFEAFAMEAKLAGDLIGTTAADVVRSGGGWTVKAHYLSPAGKRWRSTSVIDDWTGANDTDEETS